MDHVRDEKSTENLRRRVVSAVRRNCPPWLAGHAEDIVQNVLIKLLRSSRKSEEEKTFSSVYLEKAVYGSVVDEIRRVCRRREHGVDDPEALEGAASGEAGPERRSSSEEIATGVLDCLERLARPRKLAVTLYLHGWTLREAADHLTWTFKKTESLIYRGMRQLRDCLRGKGLEP
jgi:RNA polymerase sigma-70 factor (ECF subfamily)